MNRRNRIFLANLTLLVATLGFYYQRSEHKAAALANLKSTGIYTYYQSPEWLENSPEWIKKRLEELYPIELTLSATESHESLHLLKGLDVRQLDLRLEYWEAGNVNLSEYPPEKALDDIFRKLVQLDSVESLFISCTYTEPRHIISSKTSIASSNWKSWRSPPMPSSNLLTSRG